MTMNLTLTAVVALSLTYMQVPYPPRTTKASATARRMMLLTSRATSALVQITANFSAWRNLGGRHMISWSRS